ncbi:fragmin60 [Mortierella sp. GBAus27b]|nr:hypothetical protein BGX31_010121 [Mortierella sp. GBA43]KAI8361515.1 fragmin60 [Mortierella sp. GBAus27b]
MLKNSTWKLEETNLAAVGSALDKEHRKEGASHEEAWTKDTGIGSETGLWVWRIEQFKVVAVPKTQVGQFYDGDSYIVLKSIKQGDSDKLSHDIHFWLGLDTTQDEAGTAAYKTVELDDYLDGRPVQHREVQGNESDLFISYFKSFSVLHGGVNSGFNHWEEPNFVPRLLMVKSAARKGGHRTAVVVREVSKDHINSGDVFLLDQGKTLYQWNGKQSSVIEKVKAAEYVSGLQADRQSLDVTVVDEGDRDQKLLWAVLGGEVAIKAAEEVSEEPDYVKKLYRLSDASGSVKFTLEGEGPKVNRDLLDSNDVFILDVGHEVFVWVGSKANKEEHRLGLHYAQKYLKDEGRNTDTPIAKFFEEGNHTAFDNALDRF